MHFPWPLFFLLLPTTLAILVNVTIDDTLGDSETGKKITYSPPGAWNSGPGCTGCTAHLDQNRTWNGTWHDATHRIPKANEADVLPLAVVPFYGSAIYVYCVLANSHSEPNGNSDMKFLIDAQEAGVFQLPANGLKTFEYNTLVFSDTSLPPGPHTLTIQNGRIGGEKSLVLLDYIVYTTNKDDATNVSSDPTSTMPTDTDATSAASTPTKVNPSGKIVGGVLGSVSVVLLGLVAFLWRRQQKSRPSVDSASAPDSPSNSPPWRFFSGWLQRWKEKQEKPKSDTASRFSFNPSLFVSPMMNRTRALVSRPPPAVITILPRHNVPSHRPDCLQLLQPNRENTPPLPNDLHLPRDSRLEPTQPLSIIEWQRRTQMEADAIPPRFDISEVDLSSYYDDSSATPDPPPPPRRGPPQPGQRRFTVVNN